MTIGSSPTVPVQSHVHSQLVFLESLFFNTPTPLISSCLRHDKLQITLYHLDREHIASDSRMSDQSLQTKFKCESELPMSGITSIADRNKMARLRRRIPRNKTKAKAFQFLELPAELRNTVYEEVLRHTMSVFLPGMQSQDQIRAAKRKPAILQVCRQMRDEAEQVYPHLLQEEIRHLEILEERYEEHMDRIWDAASEGAVLDAKLYVRLFNDGQDAIERRRHLTKLLDRERDDERVHRELVSQRGKNTGHG